MQTVNYNFLSFMLGGITGSADIDEESLQYENVNKNDVLDIKNNIIIPKLKNHFDTAPIEYKKAVKLSLSYYLTKRNIDFGRIFDSCLIAFDHPDNPTDFFIWVWEIFFPNENYLLINLDDYQEVDDNTEPLKFISQR